MKTRGFYTQPHEPHGYWPAEKGTNWDQEDRKRKVSASSKSELINYDENLFKKIRKKKVTFLLYTQRENNNLSKQYGVYESFCRSS